MARYGPRHQGQKVSKNNVSGFGWGIGLIQKAKVVKETAGIVSQINSANDLIENSKKILHNPNDLEKNKDIPEDGFNQ